MAGPETEQSQTRRQAPPQKPQGRTSHSVQSDPQELGRVGPRELPTTERDLFGRSEIGRGIQDFLEAFEKCFVVDLEMEKWPEKKRQGDNRLKVAIRDRGVVRIVLQRAGREDLADRASFLSDDQARQIGDRAHGAAHENLEKAIESAVMEYSSSGG